MNRPEVKAFFDEPSNTFSYVAWDPGTGMAARARSVRSTVYFFSAPRWLSASWLFTWPPPRTELIAEIGRAHV